MKTTSLSFLAFFNLSLGLVAQNVTIPDTVFKAYLLGETSLNLNLDNEIQITEAAAFTGTINCGGKGISDLTGIASFTATTELRCDYNNLTTLDVSKNTALVELRCNNNMLTSINLPTSSALTNLSCWENKLVDLDISQNPNLGYLSCEDNQISSMDVSNNFELYSLTCGRNEITSINFGNINKIRWLKCPGNKLINLDVSKQIPLGTLICYDNNLDSLDLKNNMGIDHLECSSNNIKSLDLSGMPYLTLLDCGLNKLTSLNLKNGENTNIETYASWFNPNLTCIQVDDPAYSTANWIAVDTVSTFSANCSGTIGVSTISNSPLRVYPNPTTNSLHVNIRGIKKVKILDLRGGVVKVIGVKSNNIDVSNLVPGSYLIQVITENKMFHSSFVKQ